MKKTIIVLVFIFTALMCFSTGCSKTHEYGTLIAKTDATCTTTGMKAHYKCIDCDKYFDQDKNEVAYEDLIIAIDANAHEYDTQTPIESLHSVCKVCHAGATVADSYSKIVSAINSAEDGAVIYLKAGNYTIITVNKNVDNLIIAGEDGTTVKSLVVANGSNVNLYNLTFSGSIESDGILVSGSEQDGLNLYNCKFKNTANISGNDNTVVKNLALYNCEFDIGGTNITAIKLRGIDGITLKDNTFTYVPYNVIQIGEENSVKGDIVITGNRFVHVGSRILYFVKVGVITSCDISGNWFYDNSEYCNKDTGCYFKISGQGITIGVNYWENIPDITDDTYFECVDFDCELTEYDESAQQSIPIE